MNINPDNLIPTETDLFIDMLKNSEKLVSENKRKNFAEFSNYNDDLDNDVLDNNTYYQNEEPKIQEIPKETEHHNTPQQNYSQHYSNKEDDYEKEPKKLSKNEEMLLKLDMLRKLLEQKHAGIKLSQNYNLDSDLEMMQYEYKLHNDIKAKHNSVTWMSHMLVGIMKGTEILNNMVDPFGISLDGLSNKISTDMSSYYSVLGEIYEKYNSPGKQMAPELRLLFMISGAVLTLQLNKKTSGASKQDEEKMYADLRKKAEEDSKKTQQLLSQQHDLATQKTLDLKIIKEQELETQKINKTINDTKFKENLLISSASPYNNDEGDDEENEEKNNVLTKNEIEKIKQNKYIEEQKHLENIRKLAHKKSELFRNNNSSKNNLEKNNLELDEIMKNLNNDEDSNFSSKSSKSIVSINKNLSSLMKKKKKLSDNAIDLLLSSHSENSSKSKNNKKIDLSSISIGSKTKGVKPLITLG